MVGRDGDEQPEQPELPELPEQSDQQRAVRGRPGERSRAALADLAGEVEERLATDVATNLETDAPTSAEQAGQAVQAGQAGRAVHAGAVLGTCVEVIVGARRLAGWCEYVQVLAVARLLAAWSGRPPILDERVGPDPCGLGEFADPALADRLHAVADDLGIVVPAGNHLDTHDLADAS